MTTCPDFGGFRTVGLRVNTMIICEAHDIALQPVFKGCATVDRTGFVTHHNFFSMPYVMLDMVYGSSARLKYQEPPDPKCRRIMPRFVCVAKADFMHDLTGENRILASCIDVCTYN
jgi:hypothetical protein